MKDVYFISIIKGDTIMEEKKIVTKGTINKANKDVENYVNTINDIANMLIDYNKDIAKITHQEYKLKGGKK